MINSSLNMSDMITNEERTPVAVFTSTIDLNNENFNLSLKFIDKEYVNANLSEVQTRLDAFMAQVKQKMAESGFTISI